MYFICLGIQRKAANSEHEQLLKREGIPEGIELLSSLTREGVIHEGFFLYTSDCAEFYAVSGGAEAIQKGLEQQIFRFLKDNAQCEYREYHFYRQETISHFLRISGGLDIIPVGESSILEQIKECFTASMNRDCTGPFLTHLFQVGLQSGYRIRRETRIGDGAVRIEEATVELAEKIIDSVKDKTALIMGKGSLTRRVAVALARKNIGRLIFCNPLYEQSESSASHCGGEPIPWEQRFHALEESNLIIAAEHFPSFIFDAKAVEKAVRNKGRTSFIFFDCIGAGAFPPEVKNLANVFYYEREQIESIIAYNLSERKREIPKAELIIRATNEAYHQWLYSDQRYIFRDIVAKSRSMQKVLEMVQRIADTDITVLIQGETGTGKEIIARAIHRTGRRMKGPFIVVNCGAIPETLLESELFGHTKGSFTGAVSNKIGLFQEAQGGTIFLDEIGDTTSAIQIKLLRVLQEKEILPIGKTIPIKVDVRVIAASNRDLQELVRKGYFRQDLYFRLNVVQLTLPPLRERVDDMIPLAQYFIKKFCSAMNKTVYELSDEVEEILMHYQWPGNVRELENAMERAVALTLGFRITPTDLPANIQQYAPEPEGQTGPFSQTKTLRDIEREHIKASLVSNNWNYGAVAESLGIGRTTLWRKIKRYGIKPPAGFIHEGEDALY